MCFNVFAQNVGDIIIEEGNPIITTVEQIYPDGRIYYDYTLVTYSGDIFFAQLNYTHFAVHLNIYIRKIENNFPDFDGIKIIYQYNESKRMIYLLQNGNSVSHDFEFLDSEKVEYNSDLFIQNVDKENYKIEKLNNVNIINSSSLMDIHTERINEEEEFKIYSLNIPYITYYYTDIKNIIIHLDGFSRWSNTINFYACYDYWLARFFLMAHEQGIK
jgi:hypothetical protein